MCSFRSTIVKILLLIIIFDNVKHSKSFTYQQADFLVSRGFRKQFVARDTTPLKIFGAPRHPVNSRVGCRKNALSMVNPWSVSSSSIESTLFAASLFPYLGFLYFLQKDEVAIPKLALFGFRFLLVFVFATIPAGILAKAKYGVILADADLLHGLSESLLTLTNLLITLGFRRPLREKGGPGLSTIRDGERLSTSFSTVVLSILFATLPMVALNIHQEPPNALSIPTWIIHVSSIIEWLAAMSFVWQWSLVSGNPRWKGLTWGMLPLHTSGLCACTFHLFYNSPEVRPLVALQAFLTCIGNTTMAFATWRIFNNAVKSQEQTVITQDTTFRLQEEDLRDDELVYLAKLFVVSGVLAFVVKYGELLSDLPFDGSVLKSMPFIAVPTAVNIWKWFQRSDE